ncbi:energy transducer TonB [Candidatus Poribacteria bacterium]
MRSTQTYLSGYYSRRRERREKARKACQPCDSVYVQKLKSIRLKREDVLSINAIRNEDRKFRRSVTTSRFSVSVLAVSIILHVGVLFALAWVKLYVDEDVGKAEIPVVFVQELKAAAMRRSLLVRPAASLSESAQHRPAGQQVAARPIHGASSDFYIADMSEEVFSQIGALGHEVNQGVGIQRPSIDSRQNLVKPTTAELRESSPSPQMQTGNAIHELIADDSSALAKPEMRIAADDNDILKGFLIIVRSKIETEKKYPVSARSAGIEGRSGVRMTILSNGQLERAEVVDPSGYEILDNAALQSVRDASPFPPIPAEAGRDKIGMLIYLVFRIT